MSISEPEPAKIPQFYLKVPRVLRRGSKTYDLLCAAPLILWFGFSLYSQVQYLADELSSQDAYIFDMHRFMTVFSHVAILLFAGLLIYLLVRRHPPIAGTGGFFPRFAAVAGTYLSTAMLMLPKLPALSLAAQIGTFLTLFGTAFAVYALLTLGRCVSMLSEARELVTAGPYRVVRHPLYLGEQIALVGLMLQFFSYWAVGLLALQFTFQIYRMQYEESLMKQTFPEYRSYASKTWRFLPLIY